MLARLALLFILVPLVELVILVQLGRWVGLLPTLALVVVTGVLGAALARAQGLRAFLAVQRELAGGRLPGRALLDGLAILVGGAFLLTPGLLTDLVGFSLLIPRSRRWMEDGVRRWLERQMREGRVQMGVLGSDGWIVRTGTAERPDLDPRKEIEQKDRE